MVENSNFVVQANFYTHATPLEFGGRIEALHRTPQNTGTPKLAGWPEIPYELPNARTSIVYCFLLSCFATFTRGWAGG